MNEYWKPIPGFEGLYEVSDQGRVKSLLGRVRPKGHILKPIPHANDYLYVSLYRDHQGYPYHIARLVLQAFVGEPIDVIYVNHKNLDRTDNRLCNLEWVTPKQNAQHALANGAYPNQKGVHNPSSKLVPEDVREIRRLYALGGHSYATIGKKFGVTNWAIRDVIKRRNWKHVQ